MAEPTVLEIAAECTTKETALDGKRYSCRSDWSTLKAPPGHVFIKDDLEVNWTSKSGSENSYAVQWDDEVEVIPGTGIELPTTMQVQVRARSPKGPASGRGWSKAKFVVPITKYRP